MDQTPLNSYEAIQDNLVPGTVDDDGVEHIERFDYTDFQVVRGEFFSHMNEPCICFSDSQFYANSAAVKKLPDTDYVQILISPNDKKILIRAAREDDKDSFLWVTYRRKDNHRNPKKVTCKIFYAKLYDSMGWKLENKYRFVGRLLQMDNERFFLFDLNSQEVFQQVASGKSKRRSRIPAYQEDWKNQFGLPFEEHEKSLRISTFDDFVIFSVKDPEEPMKNENSTDDSSTKEPEGHEEHHAVPYTGIGGSNVFRSI